MKRRVRDMKKAIDSRFRKYYKTLEVPCEISWIPRQSGDVLTRPQASVKRRISSLSCCRPLCPLASLLTPLYSSVKWGSWTKLFQNPIKPSNFMSLWQWFLNLLMYQCHWGSFNKSIIPWVSVSEIVTSPIWREVWEFHHFRNPNSWFWCKAPFGNWATV